MKVARKKVISIECFSPFFWVAVHSTLNYARLTRTLKAKTCYMAFGKLSSFPPPEIKTTQKLKSHTEEILGYLIGL